MLITIENESTRAAYGATSDCSRLDMRGDGGNTPRNSIQLRADPPRLLVPVAPSRVEENDGAFFLPYRQPDAACRGRIAFGVFGFILGVLFVLPLILAGIAVKFG